MKHWQVEQGLPQNYVTSIAQRPDGLLVVGTSGGVAHFDGVGFDRVVLDPANGLSREWINAVAVTPDGRLWIASRDAGLFMEFGGITAKVPGSTSRRPSLLLVRRDGSLAGSGEGAMLLDANGQKILNEIESGDLSWQGLTESEDGKLLVCTVDGVLEVTTSSNRLLVRLGVGERPLAIIRGSAGRYHVGATGGLYRLTVSGSPMLARVQGVPGPVVNLVEDRDGIVWAATWGHGLYRVIGGRAESWTSAEGLPDDFVHSIFEDAEGSLWVGTRSGLSRWRSGPIVPYGPPEGLPAQFISAVAGGPGDSILVGTWRSGLYRYRRGRFAREDLGGRDEITLIRALAPATADAYWFSDWFNLNHVTGSGRSIYTQAMLGHPANANALLVDRQRALWIGGQNGLYKHPGGRPDVAPQLVLANHAIRCLVEARDGAIWAGTLNGLFRISDGQPTAVRGLPHPEVTSLHEDSRGRLWAATRVSGIALIRNGEIRVLDHRHGLPDLPVSAIIDDGDGALWLSSPAGLFRLAMPELDEWVRGTRQGVTPIAYTDEDGLRTIEFQNVGFPSAWRDQRGHLWFPTVRGLVEVRPRGVALLPPPRTLIRGITSRLRAHEVSFTAQALSRSHRLDFRYRVEGLSEDWLGLGNQRTLLLDNLPSGNHRVLIAARERGGHWGEPAMVLVRQPARWFEAWWFRLAVGGTLAGFIWLLYCWRVSLVRRRYALVAAERSRIGREWHDTLLAGFSAVTWQLQSAEGRLPANPSGAADAIRGALSMLRHYRTEARRVISDLRHHGPEHEAFPRALERSLAEMIQNRPVAIRLTIVGEAAHVPAELGLNLLRICQEAVLNAVKHAAPSAIDVHLAFQPGRVRACIRDDGHGFNPQEVPDGHLGLEIMKERAARFRGTLTIQSEPGAGTRVDVEFPIVPGAK